MADNLWTRLTEEVGKGQLEDYIKSKYWPRPDGNFHDRFVNAGSSVRGFLGGLAGGRIGELARAAGGGAGLVAGAWAAHGAYREGQLIGNILSHPENWTVDAAGAVAPLMPPSDPTSDTDVPSDVGARYLRRKPSVTNDPSPAAPSSVPPQGPSSSLNEAYLAYLRRLNALQSQAPAVDASAANGSAVFPGTFPSPQSPQGGFGTIGQSNGGPPVGPRASNPLGSAIADWTSTVDPTGPRYAVQPSPSPDEPGGLLGMLLDHLRNNPTKLDPATP